MPRTLRLATRGSRLALVQSEMIRRLLIEAHPGLVVQLTVLKTHGDRVINVPLPEIGGKGLFTKEIEDALLDGRADLAMHSLKDLPTDMPQGLALAAYTEREDPRDVLVCRERLALDELPEGAVLGTSSLRRSAQLAHYRPDLKFQSIRGNVETRVKKLTTDNLDAIVLAGAGLTRLGMQDRITQWLPSEVSLPAAGQGIIAVQTRADDAEVHELVQAISSRESEVCATAERSALAALGGGCQTPIGLWARVEGETCVLEGVVVGTSGQPYNRERESGSVDEAEAIGRRLAQRLLDRGAAALML